MKIIDKLKDIISKNKNNIKEFIYKYKGFLISIFIFCIYIILLNHEIISFESNILFFFLTLLVSLLFVESYSNNKTFSIIGYIIAIILSTITYKIIPSKHNYYDLIYFGILLIEFVLIIKKLIKGSKFEIRIYLYNLFIASFISSLIYNIISLGFLFICIIIELLLVGNFIGTFIFDIQIILIFIFYLPTYLYIITHIKEYKIKLIDNVFKYILLSIVTISNIVVFIYIIKIIIEQSMPSNTIFSIMTLLYIGTYIVVLFVSSIENKNNYIAFSCKYLFILLSINILMQIESLYIRISNNSITMIRHIGIFVIIFEIISIIIYYYKDTKYLIKLLDILVICLLLMFICPYINIYELSMYYHTNKIKKIVNTDTIIDKKIIKKVRDSYYYVRYNDYDNYIDKKIINKIYNYCKNNNCYSYYEDDKYNDNNNDEKIYSYNYYGDSYSIDISSYKKMFEETNNIEFKNIDELKEAKYGNYIINLYDLVYLLKENNDYSINNNYIKKNRILKIDDKHDLYIKNLYLDIYEPNNKSKYISSISINGYILEK